MYVACNGDFDKKPMGVKNLCFLYKSDELGSVELRDHLSSIAIVHGVRFWSDTRASDPGFAAELRDELSRSDAIVMCVGPRGLGFYQALNEVDRIRRLAG